MGTGFLAGAGFGGLLGLASGDDESGFMSFSAGQKALMGGVVFGVAGAIIGTAVGVGQSTDERIKMHSLNNLRYLNKHSRFPLSSVNVDFKQLKRVENREN